MVVFKVIQPRQHRADLRSRAASRSPARAIDGGGVGRIRDTCSGVEGRTRPRATDEQLVGGGQGSVPENVAHVRDAGQIEAERLIEHTGGLPTVSQAWQTVRGELRAAGGGRRLQIAGRGGQGAGRLTQNMPYMFVTRDVSKVRGWLKPSACCRESHTSRVQTVRTVASRVRVGRVGGGGRARGTQRLQGEKRDCAGRP